jgi:hypothetical protein
MKTSRAPLRAKTRRPPRWGNPGLPCRSPRTLNHSDRRAPFIPFPGIRIRRAPFRRRAPFTAPPGFKPVFFMSADNRPAFPRETPGRPLQRCLKTIPHKPPPRGHRHTAPTAPPSFHRHSLHGRGVAPAPARVSGIPCVYDKKTSDSL